MNFYILEASNLEQFTEFVRSLDSQEIEDLHAALPPTVELISMSEHACYAEAFSAISGEHEVAWPSTTLEALDQISEGEVVWVLFSGDDAPRYARNFAQFTVTQEDVLDFLGPHDVDRDLASLNELRTKLAGAIAKISNSQTGLLRIDF